MNTLKDLVIKLFKGNLKKYRLFMMCNILTIAILFSLRQLYDNSTLKDPAIVDPMISSNIFAPMFFMYIFAAFFIPFTMVLLNKQIQKNYGILMSMGLAQSQQVKCVLLENVFIITISVITGIITGNLFEILLIITMKWMIGLSDIALTQTITSYLQTVVYLSVVYGMTLLWILLSLKRKNILKMIMEEREMEQKKEHKMLFISGGILFVISLMISGLFYRKTNGNMLLIGMVFSYAGMVLMIYNSDFMIKKWRTKNLFLISDYMYYFRRNAKLSGMLVLLYGIIIFINTVSGVSSNGLKSHVRKYNPYDLVYSQNTEKSDIDVEKQSKLQGVKIQYESSISFFYTRTNAVFGVDDVNHEVGSDYKVPQGKFLFVRSEVLNDGYSHEKGYVPDEIEIEKQSLSLCKDMDCLLFCKGAGLTDSVILLNQEDYNAIIHRTPEMVQILHLYRFSEPEKTMGISDYIEHQPDTSVASYCKDYIRAKKSSDVLYFLMIYISLVILMSACITFHYKLASEKEKDSNKYRLLISIGAPIEKIRRCVWGKITSVVIWPLFITIVWMLAVSYVNTLFYDHHMIGLVKCCGTGMVLGGIMYGICTGYSKKYLIDIVGR